MTAWQHVDKIMTACAREVSASRQARRPQYQHVHVAACQHVKMTTCKRALQRSKVLGRQVRSRCPLLFFSLSPSCPPCAGFSHTKEELPRPIRVSSSFPLVKAFRSSLPHVIASLFSFIGRGCQPISAFLVFSSWRAPLMLSCCPFGAVRRSLSLGVRCVRVVFLLSSFCPLLSFSAFCCPAVVVLFTLLSEAGAGAEGAHHNSNSCRLSCLGSMLV